MSDEMPRGKSFQNSDPHGSGSRRPGPPKIPIVEILIAFIIIFLVTYFFGEAIMDTVDQLTR